MPSIDERIKKEMQKVAELKRQKKMQEKREIENKRKIDTRRQIIIGEIVSEYFSDVSRFQPRRTATENKIEFAPLVNFISMLAADKVYVAQLKERANEKILQENHQKL